MSGTPARFAASRPIERGPRRVGVDERVVLVLDQADELLHDPQVEAAAHRHLDERGGRRLAGDREAKRLHAGEADVVAELRQLLGEQILHALGARVVLAIDEMQRTDRQDGGRRGRGTECKRVCDDVCCGRKLKLRSQHAQTLGEASGTGGYQDWDS